jgi:group I intron endonuclease
MKAPGVYQIRCMSSGNSYVGSSINIQKRWYLHRSDLRHENHHSLVLQRAYNKYGSNAFEWIILEIVEDTAQLRTREQYWIDNIKPRYNRTFTVNQHCLGRKNGPCKEETKEKIRQKVTGFRHTAETKALMASLQKGKKKNLSPEQRERRREQARKANTGKKRTLEQRQQISMFLKTRPVKPETLEKRRIRFQGKPWSAARRAAQKTARKPVYTKQRDFSQRPKGEKHPFAKLADADVIEILQLYATGEWGYRKLGKRFNVTRQCIQGIVKGKERKAAQALIAARGGFTQALNR